MTFLRLTTPTYFGGLPATHGEINNATSGTPAPADGVSVDVTYTGTFFVVPGEDATAANVNRTNDALSTNTDFIDDILYTSRPTPVVVDTLSGGGGDTDLTITDEVFIGKVSTTNNQEERNRLIAVVDPSTLEELTDAGGTRIVATAILAAPAGANVVGQETDGYRTNPNVEFTPNIPATTNYRLIYLTRGTVAAQSDPSASGVMGDIMGRVLTNIGRQVAFTQSFIVSLSSWFDASDLVATNIQDAIDEVVDTLANSGTGTSGADHIGIGARTTWLGGRTNPASISLFAGIDKIVTDISAATASDDGAERVGAEGYAGTGTTLTAGSVRSQLNELADELGGLATANTWTALNTFDGSNIAMEDGDIIWNTDSTNGITITQLQQAGTGANAGFAAVIEAQSGQDQTGGADNNNGGNVELWVGGQGVDGSGADGYPGFQVQGFRDDAQTKDWRIEHYCSLEQALPTGPTTTDILFVAMADGDVCTVEATWHMIENGETRTFKRHGAFMKTGGSITEVGADAQDWNLETATGDGDAQILADGTAGFKLSSGTNANTADVVIFAKVERSKNLR